VSENPLLLLAKNPPTLLLVRSFPLIGQILPSYWSDPSLILARLMLSFQEPYFLYLSYCHAVEFAWRIELPIVFDNTSFFDSKHRSGARSVLFYLISICFEISVHEGKSEENNNNGYVVFIRIIHGSAKEQGRGEGEAYPAPALFYSKLLDRYLKTT
jgi:hypothetical protein